MRGVELVWDAFERALFTGGAGAVDDDADARRRGAAWCNEPLPAEPEPPDDEEAIAIGTDPTGAEGKLETIGRCVGSGALNVAA